MTAQSRVCFAEGEVLWILPNQYRTIRFPQGFPFQVDAIMWDLPATSGRVAVHGRMLNPDSGYTVWKGNLEVWPNQPGAVRDDPRPRRRADIESAGGLPPLARPFVNHDRLHQAIA